MRRRAPAAKAVSQKARTRTMTEITRCACSASQRIADRSRSRSVAVASAARPASRAARRARERAGYMRRSSGDGTWPRQAPVSCPRDSMNSLNRSRSPSTRLVATPSQSPTFSTKPCGS